MHMYNTCWFYIFSDCQYKTQCNKTHAIQPLFGNPIINQRRLTFINHLTLLKLMKLSMQKKIAFCNQYCNKNECDSLHMCFHDFINQNCKSTRECQFGHTINKYREHNLKVLKNRNLDNINEDIIKNYLKIAYIGSKNENQKMLVLDFCL